MIDGSLNCREATKKMLKVPKSYKFALGIENGREVE